MRYLPLLLALSLPAALLGEENRYDALSKTILPILGVFAKDQKSENHAFRFQVRIEQATDLPKELAGARAEISVEAPNRLRLHGPLLGEEFTLVRDGDKIWISPGAKAKALLTAAAGTSRLPKPEKKFKLRDFELPLPEKQLVFLPALLTVKDLGDDDVDGVTCRVLDLSLMPELAKSLKSDNYVARLWIKPDHTPARLTLARKGWNIVLRFDDVAVVKELPAETWKPTSAESSDVLELSPKEYSQFLGAIGGDKE